MQEALIMMQLAVQSKALMVGLVDALAWPVAVVVVAALYRFWKRG